MGLSPQQLENIMFVDIETVSIVEHYTELPERFQSLWDKKSGILSRRSGEEKSPEEWFSDQAAISAEFGKVVCVSAGYIKYKDGRPTLRTKSYFGENELQLLKDFGNAVNQFMARPDRHLCAHNGKEFDFPYLGRRFLINGLPLPHIIADMQNKKPWEIRVLDTMQLWKFGDYRSFASLDLLTACLGVPSSKDDIDGSEVGIVYYEEKDVARIKRYCEKDVLATAQVMLRFSRQPLIAEEDFHSLT